MKLHSRIESTTLFSLIFVLSLLISIPAGAQEKNLRAYFSYTTFYSPAEGPYIETYLSIDGSSVRLAPDDNNQFSGAVQVILIFKKENVIVNFDKYLLSSPEITDTSDVQFNFLDQQRYKLDEGTYDFEMQISDVNSEQKPFIHSVPVEITYNSEEAAVSGIQIVESFKETENVGKFSKSGYDIIPYPSNFLPENMDRIIFYCEIYNINKVEDEGEKFLLSYYIEDIDHGKVLNDYVRFKKENARSVSIVFSEFNIANLKSGNYNLVVEARNKENKLLAVNKLFFQRSNPKVKMRVDDLAGIDISTTFAGNITSADTMKQLLQYLDPISSEYERYFTASIIQSDDLLSMQRYLYKFWSDRYPSRPREAWQDYLGEVNKVNLAYSTQIEKGYRTDRGRIYLKYGPPNAISESYSEPGTYPYEIWHYYQLKNGQRNKRFIFYSTDIVTNDFVLIHSDVAGELKNYRWQQKIYSRVDAGFDIDQGVKDDTWGGNSKKYFDIPR